MGIERSKLDWTNEDVKPCSVCGDRFEGDCMLTNGVCVFCYYDTDSWDSNGRLVKRKDAVLHVKYSKKKKKRRVLG